MPNSESLEKEYLKKMLSPLFSVFWSISKKECKETSSSEKVYLFPTRHSSYFGSKTHANGPHVYIKFFTKKNESKF